MKRVALIDIDGTLLDSNDAHALAWIDALGEHGIVRDFAQVRPLIGMGGDQLLPALANVRADSPVGEAISKRRKAIFAKEYLPRIRPFAGARELVERLRDEGYLCLAATSAAKDEVSALLARAAVDDVVVPGASADDVASSKPAPDIVHAALAKARVMPRDAVLLGDTPWDLEAARKAGVRAVALRCGGWDDARLAPAVAIYDDPADLLRSYADSPFA